MATGRYVTCTVCGKRGYFDRGTAKLMRQRTGPGLSVYECVTGLFHIGHRRGGLPRADYTRRRPDVS